MASFQENHPGTAKHMSEQFAKPLAALSGFASPILAMHNFSKATALGEKLSWLVGECHRQCCITDEKDNCPFAFGQWAWQHETFDTGPFGSC